MLQSFARSVEECIRSSLPGLFKEKGPALTIVCGETHFEPSDADALAGEPMPERKAETLSVDRDSPAGPYTVSLVPYGPGRQVWYIDSEGAKRKLAPDAVRWDDQNAAVFKLKGDHLPAAAVSIVVVYETLSIYTMVNGSEEMRIHCDTPEALPSGEAEVLIIGVLFINRKQLISNRFDYQDTVYGASVELKDFSIIRTVPKDEKGFTIEIEVSFILRAQRRMIEEEGAVIERILTPGARLKGPVGIEPLLDL